MHEYVLKCVWEKTTPLSGKNNTYPDAGWVTGDGPAMCMFDYFDDFVRHYRIYETSFELWYAWNAAQSFCLEEFEEVAPEENNDDVA